MNQTIEKLREEMYRLSGGWNGEDSEFIHDGQVFHEEDAHVANEIVEKIDEIKNLLDEINGVAQRDLIPR